MGAGTMGSMRKLHAEEEEWMRGGEEEKEKCVLGGSHSRGMKTGWVWY